MLAIWRACWRQVTLPGQIRKAHWIGTECQTQKSEALLRQAVIARKARQADLHEQHFRSDDNAPRPRRHLPSIFGLPGATVPNTARMAWILQAHTASKPAHTHQKRWVLDRN